MEAGYKIPVAEMKDVVIGVRCDTNEIPMKGSGIVDGKISDVAERKELHDRLLTRYYWDLIERYRLTFLGTVLFAVILIFLVGSIIYGLRQGPVNPNSVVEPIEKLERFLENDATKKSVEPANQEVAFANNLPSFEHQVVKVKSRDYYYRVTRRKRQVARDEESMCEKKVDHCKIILESMKKIATVVNNTLPHMRELIRNYSKTFGSASPDSKFRDLLDCLECKKFDNHSLVLPDNRTTNLSMETQHQSEHPEHKIDFDTVHNLLDYNQKPVENESTPVKTNNSIYADEANEFLDNSKNVTAINGTRDEGESEKPVENASTTVKTNSSTYADKTTEFLVVLKNVTVVNGTMNKEESHAKLILKDDGTSTTPSRAETTKNDSHETLDSSMTIPNATKTKESVVEAHEAAGKILHAKVYATNATVMEKGRNVTQLSNATLSSEGHSENLKNASAVERQRKEAEDSERVAKPYPYFDPRIVSGNQYPTGKGLMDPNQMMVPTAETMKSSQQLQLTPTISWMPYPVCFYGPPGAPGPGEAKHSSPGQMVYPPSSPARPFPMMPPQQRGTPMMNSQGQGGGTPPNYVQVQAQSVQFLPMQPYGTFGPGFSSGVPSGQRIGPTGPGHQNFPFFPGYQPTSPGTAPGRTPYYCTYIPAPAFQFPMISGASDYQRTAEGKKDEEVEDSKLDSQDSWFSPNHVHHDHHRHCSLNSYRCNDGSCISKELRCNGHVDCEDASDELDCTCKDRISSERLCDGYFDCPQGEDELGCFGCPTNTFSCSDTNMRYASYKCVPIIQRCDGIEQCQNGKDEMDCTILTDSYIDGGDPFTIGYTSGYVHKNFRGQWYPACWPPTSWVTEACASEMGPELAEFHQMEIQTPPGGTHEGPYLGFVDGKIKVVPSCMDTIIYARCAEMPCGNDEFTYQSYSHYNVDDNLALGRRASNNDQETNLATIFEEIDNLLPRERADDSDKIVGVVGGRASKPKAWPFLVAIYKDGKFHCGGVIVNDYWVLTAAHCLDNYTTHYYEVQAGVLRRYSFSPTAQSRRGTYIIPHPEYYGSNMRNDLGMIMLDRPLRFNRWVRPACLPNENTAGIEWWRVPQSPSKCVTIGWGATRERGPDPDELREVEVPILERCNNPADFHESIICAGYPEGGRDACQGDSGGPLMCRHANLENQWYVAGIVSHGEGCARPQEPGAYTKVSYFTDWITKVSNGQLVPPFNALPSDTCPGFNCQGPQVKCLPLKKQCDRIVDCLGAEDEVDCTWEENPDLYREAENQTEFIMRNRQLKNSTEKFSRASLEIKETPKISTPRQKGSSSSEVVEDITENEIVQASENRTADTNLKEELVGNIREPPTFSCTILTQTISIDKRCNKLADCEDGTDEAHCTCRDYLRNLQPTAICNGHVDCYDGTDEKDCGICDQNEFLCVQSKTCIPATRRCDLKHDCPLMEDELNCFTLTDGEHIHTDIEHRPKLKQEGVLTRYLEGRWQPVCHHVTSFLNQSTGSVIGENMCKYFGFANAFSVEQIVVKNSSLDVRFWNDTNIESYKRISTYAPWSKDSETCFGLYIHCRPVLNSSPDVHLIVDKSTGNREYMWPWMAAIFVNGKFHCSGILLEPNWLLSSSRCTENLRLSRDYLTVLLGRSSTYRFVDGPYQQVSVVDEIKPMKDSQASLLHLKTGVRPTRHVLPIFMEKKFYPPETKDLCVVVGTDEKHRSNSIFVHPVLKNCKKCERCFLDNSVDVCNNNATDWSGTVFCRGKKGWYPAAAFDDRKSPCSFRKVTSLPSIDYANAFLMQAMEDNLQPTIESPCQGFRCTLGKCISASQVCDGIEDCRDGGDENPEHCLALKERCINDANGCNCSRSELRCGNGQCVPKNAFCNNKVDCSDGTDEPARCTCADYLKLTAPERMCDGIRHCWDKSDESPEICPCKSGSFKCNENAENSTCIPYDFLCDGAKDCPEGEDEDKCVTLSWAPGDDSKSGEIIQRTSGLWHTKCYPSANVSKEEATSVCKATNFSSGEVTEVTEVTNEPVIPEINGFFIVILNEEFWLTMKKDEPLVKLELPVEPCYRVNVTCS